MIIGNFLFDKKNICKDITQENIDFFCLCKSSYVLQKFVTLNVLLFLIYSGHEKILNST